MTQLCSSKQQHVMVSHLPSCEPIVYSNATWNILRSIFHLGHPALISWKQPVNSLESLLFITVLVEMQRRHGLPEISRFRRTICEFIRHSPCSRMAMANIP